MLVFCVTVCSVTVIGINTKKPINHQSSGPEIEWIYTFDSIINDRAYYVDQTVDGGYIFTGSTVVNTPGYTELLLAKTDGNGEESWHNNFPMSMTNLYGTAVHQTTDGGYIIVGSIGGSWLWDVLVIKADANGDLVWQKTFGKSGSPDHGSDILQTSDGGYIVLGDTTSYGQGSADLWLIKLAADGTEQWNKTIGGANFDEPKSFTKAVDGGYIIVGNTDAVDGMGDVWVVKTNDAGEVSWQKTFGSSDFWEYGVCVKTTSNGYIILGNLLDMNWTENLWLLHLNTQGTLTWDKQISVADSVHGSSITATKDGGYFITGAIIDPVSYITDAYLLKLNYQCAIEWDKTLDLSDGFDDEANWGIQARDGGYVAIGSTGDFFNFTSDTFILNIEGEKMSKSLGNFFTLREVFEKFSPLTVRFFLLSAHYRAPLAFTETTLKQAESALARFNDFILRVKETTESGKAGKGGENLPALLEAAKQGFEDGLDDRPNLPQHTSYFVQCGQFFCGHDFSPSI